MRKLLFCLFFLCFPWLWLRAQQRIAFARLPPFERAVVCVKFFEGFHGKGCYPYVGYGHQLQKGEHFSSNMPEWQADSLLRADLMAQFDRFKCYGKDAMLFRAGFVITSFFGGLTTLVYLYLMFTQPEETE